MGWIRGLVTAKKFVLFFISIHVFFAIFLGRLFALAPDEAGYLYTFNNLYGGIDPNPQYNSGWITAPKAFLWISYFPARLLQLAGFSDYFSIRILSIVIATMSLILLQNLLRLASGTKGKYESMIFLFYLTPSIFLWTSVGLRESFIILEFAIMLVGLTKLFENRIKIGMTYIVLGSYGLMSTKNYLWVCLVGAVSLVSLYLALRKVGKFRFAFLFISLILIPCVIFAATTSVGALEFFIGSIIRVQISETGARSGDSMVRVAVSRNEDGTQRTTQATGASAGGASPKTTIVTFHGDTTLILLHFYIQDHPNSIFTKVLRATGIKSKLDEIWSAKIRAGLVKKSVVAVADKSSLTGYILKPASAHDPLSIFRPAFLFLFGPIPFLDQGGLALNTVSFESPIWWLLYLIVGIGLSRYGRKRIMKDPVLLFAGVLFLALVTFSALVEVNLGTSFRHRSILLVPLLVIFIRTRSKPPVLAD